MNVLDIEFKDDWIISSSGKFHCKYGRYVNSSIELMVLVFMNNNYHWTMDIFYPNIIKAFENFYSDDIKYEFNSADEAKLYFDTFINKYNKLKAFL